MANSFSIEMDKILDKYIEGTREMVDEVAKEVADDTAKHLKQTSPKGSSGKYAKGWAVKKQNGGYVVYNKTAYQLTHLLENGHVIKNGSGTYGRTRAFKHIEPAEKEANKEFQNRIEERLEKGVI